MRIAISIMVQLLSLLFTTTITGLSVTLDHSIPQNLHFFIFNKTFWIMFIPLFTSFQLAFPTQFPMNYSCNIIMPSLVLLLCQLFAFAHNMRYCFTILVTHSTKWWLGCFIYLMLHIVWIACSCTAYKWLLFQLSGQLFSAITMFLFHLLFLAFLVQNVHTFFCFSIVPSFPSSIFVWIPSYSLYHYILLFLQLLHLQSMAQLNSWHTIPNCFLTSSYIPHDLSIPVLPFPR